ncbi:hypothetical protein MKQ70_34595 [Chitinophaga sedimenti]|uniref:hypothetical protein n=1 Tax=Chitinophaga sedimenti TaxID=2033606 RepID=UPI0020036193|nr:hypothetical protein [Chitinophaga sedimenti]MCK7559796.1 hypothetical protein [Chitinophaga sedimenti]
MNADKRRMLLILYFYAFRRRIFVRLALDTIAAREKAQLLPTGAEQAVDVIRGMLRMKKV